MFHTGETVATLRARRVTDIARQVLPAVITSGALDKLTVGEAVVAAFNIGEVFTDHAEKLAEKAEEAGRAEFATKVETMKKEVIK